MLRLVHLVHGALPLALADFGIGGGEVGSGDVQVDGGLAEVSLQACRGICASPVSVVRRLAWRPSIVP